jgi:hypothetical protein
MFTGGHSLKRQFCFRNYALHSASIVVQLMGIAIPYLQKLQLTSGRKRLIRLHVG